VLKSSALMTAANTRTSIAHQTGSGWAAAVAMTTKNAMAMCVRKLDSLLQDMCRPCIANPSRRKKDRFLFSVMIRLITLVYLLFGAV